MELCNDGHDEIVHESRQCPVCEAHMKIDSLNDRIDNLKDQIAELDSEVVNLQSDLEDALKEKAD